MEDSRSKLILPLDPLLIKYINHEYSELAQVIMQTLEETVKDSSNHYHDLIRSLEPFLRDRTKGFVDKLFMFRRKLCRESRRCKNEFCLFAHSETDVAVPKRGQDPGTNKRPKIDNSEVVLNKVDEAKFCLDDLRSYSSKFGSVMAARRLNKGKYLIVFRTHKEAIAMVESLENPLGDPEIKKFFNVIAQNNDMEPEEIKKKAVENKAEIAQLLKEQKELLDDLSLSFDKITFISLKNVTNKIRSYLIDDYENQETSVESSLFYSMFA